MLWHVVWLFVWLSRIYVCCIVCEYVTMWHNVSLHDYLYYVQWICMPSHYHCHALQDSSCMYEYHCLIGLNRIMHVCMSGHESRWYVHKSLNMKMYKCVRKCIQWTFHPWVMTWYIYVLAEFIVHDLWDMHVLAELRLTTYVCVIGTKGKHVSNTWVWDVGVGGL